ncbi:MAG: carbohydrate ABC transporter permease [Bacilli bacterium]
MLAKSSFADYSRYSRKIKRNVNLKRTIFIFALLIIPVLNYLIFFVYVNFRSITLAFQFTTSSGTEWSLYNFQRFFKEIQIPELDISTAVKNNILLFVQGTLIGTPLCLLLSYFLYKKIKGYKIFRVIFFLPSIISAVVLVGLFKNIFATNGPINGLLSSILGRTVDIEWMVDDNITMYIILFFCLWSGFGGGMILFTGAMNRIPKDVLEYARLDGCSSFRELFQIIIPMIWPTLSTQLLFSISSIFVASGPILLFTKGQFKTMTIGYFILEQVEWGSYEYPAAIGLFFTLISIPIILITRKLFNATLEDIEY